MIFTIKPYWKNGTWCFTDKKRDLYDEAFVCGTPQILSKLIKDIPNVYDGFNLIFSDEPFPDFQLKVTRISSEYDGTWYITSEGEKGWLCSALFRYFEQAPQYIYVKGELND